MTTTNKNKHLTCQERIIIETGIRNGSSKSAIANILGKDKSTIGKEISLHRSLKKKCNMPLECTNYKKCVYGRHCTPDCPRYAKFICKRRDRSPGACNGCSNYNSCHFNKYVYSSSDADHDYKEILVNSREGVNLTTSEAKALGEIIAPLIRKGQSPYQIVTEHPELGFCEKTLYNYIEGGIFDCVGLHNIDLRIKVKRKMTKNKEATYKKRVSKKYLNGRLYSDYLAYKDENPNVSVVQMDTVYNDETKGPFIQTFKFLDYGFLFAVYHKTKTAEDMNNGVALLEKIIGQKLFNQNVELLLTDRGTEFSNPETMEIREDNSRRTRVYYCDPMRSGQKGSLENKHRELRYIIPKKTDLRDLGLIDQASLNLALSHVNSATVESLKGKSPIEMMRFLNEDLLKKFVDFGIVEIEKDKVTLKPYLLKK